MQTTKRRTTLTTANLDIQNIEMITKSPMTENVSYWNGFVTFELFPSSDFRPFSDCAVAVDVRPETFPGRRATLLRRNKLRIRFVDSEGVKSSIFSFGVSKHVRRAIEDECLRDSRYLREDDFELEICPDLILGYREARNKAMARHLSNWPNSSPVFRFQLDEEEGVVLFDLY